MYKKYKMNHKNCMEYFYNTELTGDHISMIRAWKTLHHFLSEKGLNKFRIYEDPMNGIEKVIKFLEYKFNHKK